MKSKSCWGDSFSRVQLLHPPPGTRTNASHHDRAVARVSVGCPMLRRVLAAGAVGVDPFEQTPPTSRRRPRRLDVVTYRVRIDLKGTRPPLWCRLEVASDLFLGDFHDVIQVAFGWTDNHLHRFGCGSEYYSHDTEYYLCHSTWSTASGLKRSSCHEDSALRAVCTAGRRPGPAEDCGGVYGYELIAAARCRDSHVRLLGS
jgi:hypothetical protein